MRKTLVITGFIAAVMLVALSGCETQKASTESAKVQAAPKVEAAKEAPAAPKVEVVKEVKVVEKAPSAPKVEVPKEVKVVEKAPEAPKAPAPPAAAKTSPTDFVLRVDCGSSNPYTDKAGNLWVADQVMAADKKWGVTAGEATDRGSLNIEGTDCPGIYQTERFSMENYKFIVPNGEYTVKLHFAETYTGVSGAGERVFSVTINGETVIKDVDPYKDGGGVNKPVVKTIPNVQVRTGELVIGFTMNIQNPEINGIEIISD